MQLQKLCWVYIYIDKYFSEFRSVKDIAGSLIWLSLEAPDILHFIIMIYETCLGKHICIYSLARGLGFSNIYFRVGLGHGDVNSFYKLVHIFQDIYRIYRPEIFNSEVINWILQFMDSIIKVLSQYNIIINHDNFQ